MKRLTATVAALLLFSCAVNTLWALPALSKKTINPARIVQLSSSIRFLYKRVSQTNPELKGRAKLEEVCTLLKHLGFQVPTFASLPSDVTKMELATSILTGQAPQRGEVLVKKKAIPKTKTKLVAVKGLPPINRPEPEEDRVTNASRTINVLPVARLRFSTLGRRRQLKVAKPMVAKDEKPVASEDLRTRIRQMLADKRTEVPQKAKDKLGQMITKLAKVAQKQLKAHRAKGMTVNKLIINSWKGMGLPCPQFKKDWQKLSPTNLAQSIRENLSESDRNRVNEDLKLFLGS